LLRPMTRVNEGSRLQKQASYGRLHRWRNRPTSGLTVQVIGSTILRLYGAPALAARRVHAPGEVPRSSTVTPLASGIHSRERHNAITTYAFPLAPPPATRRPALRSRAGGAAPPPPAVAAESALFFQKKKVLFSPDKETRREDPFPSPRHFGELEDLPVAGSAP